jgi:hypothetical protein
MKGVKQIVNIQQRFAVCQRPEARFTRRLKQSKKWCGREDSNFHGLSPTTTSTLRVYQFRHGRTRLGVPGEAGVW